MKPQLIIPEINANQKKLLLRELLEQLPDKKMGVTFATGGFNEAIDQVTTVLTEFFEGEHKQTPEEYYADGNGV